MIPNLKNPAPILSLAITFVCAILFSYPVFALSIDQEIYRTNVDSPDTINSKTALKNIQAFAKLYGYLRFFHPSDEASAIDWDRFTIYGVQHVKNADSPLDLKNKLIELFAPIAPTIQVYPADKKPPTPASILIPDDTTGLKLVAWQHNGFGFDINDYYQSIRLNRPTENPAEPLFEDRPKAGEVSEKLIGRGLAAQIPLALYSKDGQTLRPENAPPVGPFIEKLESVTVENLSAEDEALRYADVVMAWNVFQHFYPYFDVVDTDWDNVLSEALLKASDDRTAEDFLDTLKWINVQLKDGHGIVRLQDVSKFVGFPFSISEIEEKLMITAVSINADENICYKQGDTITSINGEPAGRWFKEMKKLNSGTPQWKTALALSDLNYGLPGEKLTFVLNRSGKIHTCKFTRKRHRNIAFKRPGPIEEIQKEIYYVNLSRATMDEIEKMADTLAAAKGIVFDQRGYPNSTHDVLRYLSKDTLRSAHWMIPQVIYPDQINIAGYDTSGRWTLEPKEPYFKGKKVFLIGKNTSSYGESVMGIVEHYKLAEMVGRTTAGTNGAVNTFILPSGYRVSWTGMKVLKHDYSQHHLIGIIPTVPVERTVEGVREGRDEYLEKALELIKKRP